MKLISSAETISFLAAAAPRPWIKRMLLWMIYQGDLSPYFRVGEIEVLGRVVDLLHQLPKDIFDNIPRQNYSVFAKRSPELENALLHKFDSSITGEVLGKNGMDIISDRSLAWNESEAPHQVGAGFFVWADEIDWEKGKLTCENIPADFDKDEHLFWDAEEHLTSLIFERPDFRVSLSGMCFELNAIEMLLPTEQVESGLATVVMRSDQMKQIGRPRKWDWDTAFAHIVALANRPDGLPTGLGAQARIEELLSQWFVDQTGDAPSTSQIRTRAQIIVRSMG